MRCSATVNAIFFILLFLGIGSYMYMMWVQYKGPQKHDTSQLSLYDREIYLYNRGKLFNGKNNSEMILSRTKHELNDLRPRIPSSNRIKIPLDTQQFQCTRIEAVDDAECEKKTEEFKNKILMHLTNTIKEESNVLNTGYKNNSYNVHYLGKRKDFRNNSRKQVLCEFLTHANLQTLKRSDILFRYHNLKNVLPKKEFLENKYFNSCAIVTGSGALTGSNLGSFIDSHEVVLRFNDAPIVKQFGKDVGSKTTIRVLNSQVVTKPEFNFLDSPMFKNITLVLWDPTNYSTTLEEWLKNPEYNLFPNFIQYKRQETKPKIHLINPLTIWNVWNFMQSNYLDRLKKNPPSSGFLGFRLLLSHCDFIDIFEYIPSTRVTKRCHYYDSVQDSSCTFGVWHPLSAEKLLTFHLNSANNYEVFQQGFVRISGLRNLQC